MLTNFRPASLAHFTLARQEMACAVAMRFRVSGATLRLDVAHGVGREAVHRCRGANGSWATTVRHYCSRVLNDQKGQFV